MRKDRPAARTLCIEEESGELGISRWMGYRLARTDSLPVPVIRVGKRLVVSRQAMEELPAQREPEELNARAA